jgi:hypothetical protein
MSELPAMSLIVPSERIARHIAETADEAEREAKAREAVMYTAQKIAVKYLDGVGSGTQLGDSTRFARHREFSCDASSAYSLLEVAEAQDGFMEAIRWTFSSETYVPIFDVEAASDMGHDEHEATLAKGTWQNLQEAVGNLIHEMAIEGKSI